MRKNNYHTADGDYIPMYDVGVLRLHIDIWENTKTMYIKNLEKSRVSEVGQDLSYGANSVKSQNQCIIGRLLWYKRAFSGTEAGTGTKVLYSIVEPTSIREVNTIPT